MSSAGAAKEPTYPTRGELRHLADQDLHGELSERLKQRTTKVAIATAMRRRREAMERLQQGSESGFEGLPALPRDVMRLILLRTDSDSLPSASLASPEFAYLVHCDDYFWREKYGRDLLGLMYLWGGELPPGFPSGTRMVPWKVFYGVMAMFHQHLVDYVWERVAARRYDGQLIHLHRLDENRFRKVTFVKAISTSEPISDVVISLDRYLRVGFGLTVSSFVKHLVDDSSDRLNHDTPSSFFLMALRTGDITHSLPIPAPSRNNLSFAAAMGRRDALSLLDVFKHERPPRSNQCGAPATLLRVLA